MVDRTLTTAFKTALDNPNVEPYILVTIGTAQGDINVWSGIGDLPFDSGIGATIFKGIGNFGTISGPQETSELRANGVNVTLSGISSQTLSLALQSMRQGKTGRIWMGLFDISTGAVIDSPAEIFEGLTDIVAINESAETSEVTVALESTLVNLKKKHDRRYTPEDQKRTFPNDLGFDFVTSLQEKELLFGKARE